MMSDDTVYFRRAMEELGFQDFAKLSSQDARLVLWRAQVLKESAVKPEHQGEQK